MRVNKLLLIILSLLLLACNRESINSSGKGNYSQSRFGSSTYYDAKLDISVSQVDKHLKGALVGGVFKNGSETISVGKLKVAGDSIPFNGKMYYNTCLTYDCPLTREMVFGWFNKNTLVEFEGNAEKGYPAFSEWIEFPKNIRLLMNLDSAFHAVSEGEDLVVTWEPDGRDHIFMGFEVSDFDFETNVVHIEIIKDNGKLVIPSNILNKFSKKETLNITLYRYTANEFDVGEHKFRILTKENCNLGNFNFVEL